MLQWKVGDVTVTSVAELDDGAVPGPMLIPEATSDSVLGIEWLRPHFIDDAGNLLLRIQALVVESKGRQIVVDTCLGNDKPRTQPFFQELQAFARTRPRRRRLPLPGLNMRGALG